MIQEKRQVHRPQSLVLAVITSAALCLLSFYNYLLFHALVEIFSVVVAGGIFIVAWNTRSHMSHDYLFFVGIAYLFVGFTDLIHTLAYKGMGVFPWATADEPTQLWILARSMEALSLAAAPSFERRRVRADLVFSLFAGATALGMAAVFWWKIFPTCFVEGAGLTAFKIASEVVIIGLVAVAMVRFKGIRHLFPVRVYHLIFWALLCTIGAELAFTLYRDVFGLPNMLGHLFKLLSFAILYEALLQTGFRDPFALLFRELKESETSLREEKAKLEEALREIKVLKGLLPICSFCKRIRDDRGYWQSLENYLRTHTQAQLSHGICPECLKEKYPEYAEQVLGAEKDEKNDKP